MLRASQNYLQHLQSRQRAYESATRAMSAAKVLSAANLEERSQLQDRRTLVQNFLSANAGLKTAVQQGETNYRAELTAFDISPQQKQAAVAGFMKSYSAQAPLLITIRDADQRMGQAILGVLDLFDSQWGHWHYDASSRLVRFEEAKAVTQYNAFMADIKHAGVDQAAAQQRLAAVLGRSEQTL